MKIVCTQLYLCCFISRGGKKKKQKKNRREDRALPVPVGDVDTRRDYPVGSPHPPETRYADMAPK